MSLHFQMKYNLIMYTILTLITGLCISIMIFFNGSLEGVIGNYPALISIHITGFTLSSLMFMKRSSKESREKRSPWYLSAGLLGIIVVTITNQVFKRGGVLVTLSGTLTGQVLLATVMELISHIKKRENLPTRKTLSIALVLPGAILLGLRSDLSPLWIVISWIPGILILTQSFMNSQNIVSIGFRKTLLFHFGTVVLILIPGLFIFSVDIPYKEILSGDVPILFLTGGGTVALFVISIGSYLLLKIKPITYVLLIYSGQIAGAIIIDIIIGNNLSLEKIAAMGLIVVGLFIGEIKKS